MKTQIESQIETTKLLIDRCIDNKLEDRLKIIKNNLTKYVDYEQLNEVYKRLIDKIDIYFKNKNNNENTM